MPGAGGKGLPRDASLGRALLQLGAKRAARRPEPLSLWREAAALGEPGYHLQLKGASDRLVIADVVVHVAGVAAQGQGQPPLPGGLLRLEAGKAFYSPEDPIGPSGLPFLLTAETKGGGEDTAKQPPPPTLSRRSWAGGGTSSDFAAFGFFSGGRAPPPRESGALLVHKSQQLRSLLALWRQLQFWVQKRAHCGRSCRSFHPEGAPVAGRLVSPLGWICSSVSGRNRCTP